MTSQIIDSLSRNADANLYELEVHEDDQTGEVTVAHSTIGQSWINWLTPGYSERISQTLSNALNHLDTLSEERGVRIASRWNQQLNAKIQPRLIRDLLRNEV